MEVMLEIYRTLKALGFEWKRKDADIIEVKSQKAEEEEMKRSEKRSRKDEEERVKKAQDLYFVETRCRYDDVLVGALSLICYNGP